MNSDAETPSPYDCISTYTYTVRNGLIVPLAKGQGPRGLRVGDRALDCEPDGEDLRAKKTRAAPVRRRDKTS